MKAEPVQKKKYGDVVWVNPTLEAIREEECLCLNCDSFKPNTATHCQIAAQFFEICKEYNTAFPMSWCKYYQK